MRKLSRSTVDPQIEDWDERYEQGKLRLPSLAAKLEKRFGSDAATRILTRMRKGMYLITAVYADPDLFSNPRPYPARITKRTPEEDVDEQLRKLKEEIFYKHAQYFKQSVRPRRNPMLHWYAGKMSRKVGDIGGVIVFSSPNDYSKPSQLSRVRGKFSWLLGPFSTQTAAAKSLARQVKFSNAPVPITVIHKGSVTVQHLVDPSRKKVPAKKKSPAKKTTSKKKNPPKSWHEYQLAKLKKTKSKKSAIKQETEALKWHDAHQYNPAVALPEPTIGEMPPVGYESMQAQANPKKRKGKKSKGLGPSSEEKPKRQRGGRRIRRKQRRIRKITKRLTEPSRVTGQARTPEQLKRMHERLKKIRASLVKLRAERVGRRTKGGSTSLGRARKRTKGLRTGVSKRTPAEIAARKARKTARKAKRGSSYSRRAATPTKWGRRTRGIGVGRRRGISIGGGSRGVMKNPPSLRYVVLEVDHRDLKGCMTEKKGPFTHEEALDALPKLKKLYRAMGFKIHYARVH